MWDFLPAWVKAIMGCGLVVLIAVQGFKLTSKSGSSSGAGNTQQSNTAPASTSNENKEG